MRPRPTCRPGVSQTCLPAIRSRRDPTARTRRRRICELKKRIDTFVSKATNNNRQVLVPYSINDELLLANLLSNS